MVAWWTMKGRQSAGAPVPAAPAAAAAAPDEMAMATSARKSTHAATATFRMEAALDQPLDAQPASGDAPGSAVGVTGSSTPSAAATSSTEPAGITAGVRDTCWSSGCPFGWLMLADPSATRRC